MATHSSILAWRIPWTEEPGRPQSVASQRVRHNGGTKQQQGKATFPPTHLVLTDSVRLRPQALGGGVHASSGGRQQWGRWEGHIQKRVQATSKDGLNKQKCVLCSWIGTQHCSDGSSLQTEVQIQPSSHQNPFFPQQSHRNRQAARKIHVEMQGPRTAETVLEKNQVGGLFKLSTQLCVQDRVHWRKDRRVHRWNRADSPEINPHSYGQLILDKGAKIIQWGKNSLFSKLDNRVATCKRIKCASPALHTQKLTQNGSKTSM